MADTDNAKETLPLHCGDLVDDSKKYDVDDGDGFTGAQKDFDKMFRYQEHPKLSILERLNKRKSKLNIFSIISSVFPVLTWLSSYKWHTDLFYDVISGLTVAIIQIPQGLASSILAGVPPVIGVYTSFFPVLVYALMGTSRQSSIGTFGIISIMSYRVVQEVTSSSPVPYTAIEIVSALSFTVGIWQILLSLARLGSLSVILSESLISGLVTGAAVLIITSQLEHLFGFDLPKHEGALAIIKTIRDVFDKVHEINYMAFAITLSVTVVLLVYQQLLKPILAKRTPIPVPVELIIIICGTTLSKYYDLSHNFLLNTVGNIPTGFPPFTLPPLELVPQLVVHGFVIAIISFSINISLASIFAQKHKYRIDANQELLAVGSANMFGSFFKCVPVAASLSRSSIQDSTGGRSQLTSLVSCVCLSMVILFIAPYFEPLPLCVLTGILYAAMRGMLLHVKDFFDAWSRSKQDALIWLVTFCGSVFVDANVGLCIGVIASLLHITVLGQKVKVTVRGNIPGTDLYVEKSRYKSAVHIPGVIVLHVVAGMNFANKDHMQYAVYKQLEKNKDWKWSHVVLDFSAVSYVDPSSTKCLLQIYQTLENKCVSLHLAKCSNRVYKTLNKCQFFKTFPEKELYPSVHEAATRNQVL